MVKSYRGVAVVKEKGHKMQDVHVEDYMTRRLITFSPNQTMDIVIKTLITKKISGGPVVDENENLVGVISEGDCLKEVVRGKYNNTPNLSGRVEEHMTREVYTLPPETNIFDAARKFLEMKIRRFPVVKDGKLLGQISQRDIMRACQNLKDTTW
ncbi:CBS domain-containing protein [Fulvivirga sedimenti]|uniref:CBS domain-containing protein n=1 Tax=Fulvivirga sedimenti TaxID=2879465 RepID=A0A9X1KZA9_9BACT|nr:CBS domain-containing protein [Fulvivirga sedimenti]MCA6074544.1 CBS domain-containing protein [Fulvivirga sedimenti]MCA6075721.1 CBS domain-containing protein [Fulvivirga sedimenti]MCA6076849.1 CBS domain-containing protein [Fulvivirga sedimenti]